MMKAVFLDYETLSRDDIDVTPILRAGVEVELFGVTAEDELETRIADANIVIVNKVRLGPVQMDAAPGLRLVCLAATGTNNVDLDAAQARQIGVCNIMAYCTQSVVQHVFAAILNLTHRLNEYQALLHSGAWKDSPQFCMLDYPIRELSGLTIGIVGLGELGSAVARVAEAFGMRVVVANRPGTEPSGEGRLPLDDVLREADIVSLHCPLTDQTLGLIGDRELSLMKPDALLINTARGGLVDSGALARALLEGRIGGAGIDVLAQEPPVDGDALLDPGLPNLIVTPHIAWAAREARQRAVDEIAANIVSFLSGGSRRRVV
jgi:glycerate dehydrogenase